MYIRLNHAGIPISTYSSPASRAFDLMELMSTAIPSLAYGGSKLEYGITKFLVSDRGNLQLPAPVGIHMLCILYVNAVGMLLGIAGVLAERALPTAFARRWVWCIIIPISMFIPGYYRWHHNWSVMGSLQQPAIRASTYDLTIGRVGLTVSAMLILWGLANAWRVARVIQLSRRERGQNRGRAIVDGIPVLVTDLVGPATVGLLRRVRVRW